MPFPLFGQRFEIVPNWKIALFYILLMPVLLHFGFWQIERAKEKSALEQEYQKRMQESPLPLSELLALPDRAYRRVAVTGYFDAQHLVFIDNKIHQGRVGYEVLSPFILHQPVELEAGGSVDYLWINRGWIDLGGTRAYLPQVSTPERNLTLIANVDLPVGTPFMLASEQMQPGWPKVLQNADIDLLASAYEAAKGIQSAPFLVRLTQIQEGLLQSIWQPINISPAKHLGYAVQWFSMALALTLLYLYVTIKRVKTKDSDEPDTNL